MSAKWQFCAVLICRICVRSRIERLCNALVATILSAYVRSRIERLCNALVAAKHKGTPLCRIIFSRGLYSLSVPQSPAGFTLVCRPQGSGRTRR